MTQALPTITPDWPAPARVKAFCTTRHGGVSEGRYASLNLGSHVDDTAEAVAENRARLAAQLPMEPLWLTQVHGTTVVNAACTCPFAEADAAVSRMAYRICTVMTADCLPVLLCHRDGSAVGAAHAGWRGLANGMIEATVRAMQTPGEELLAWLGPAISQTAFEVGDEVRAAFLAHSPDAGAAFRPGQSAGKWHADLYQLARQRLAALGVQAVYGGEHCTYREADTFFSARRDGIKTGRMASLIWFES